MHEVGILVSCLRAYVAWGPDTKLGFRFLRFKVWVEGSGLGVWGLGFGVEGRGFDVWC